jgi:hypothetical protein
MRKGYFGTWRNQTGISESDKAVSFIKTIWIKKEGISSSLVTLSSLSMFEASNFPVIL